MKFLSGVAFSLFFLNSVQGYSAEKLDCGKPDSDIVFESLNAQDLDADLEKMKTASSSFWKVYEESFPKEERAAPTDIITSHPNNSGVALQMRQGANILGMAYFFVLEDMPVSYLTYLAIGEKYRGYKLFPSLFDCVLKESTRKFEKKGVKSVGIVWEVEIPELAKDKEDANYREKRIEKNFKLGAFYLEKDYFAPPIANNPEKFPMYLMMYSQDEKIKKESDNKEFANRVILAMYRQIYPGYWAKTPKEKLRSLD